jgi:hypothetical protein
MIDMPHPLMKGFVLATCACGETRVTDTSTALELWECKIMFGYE